MTRQSYQGKKNKAEISKALQKNSSRKVNQRKKRLQFYLKTRLWHRLFPVNFATLLRTPFENASESEHKKFDMLCKSYLSKQN